MDATLTHTPPPEFVSKANTIDRIDSGETDESPFPSNLVTPTEGQEHLTRGIHERFDLAKTVMGYFGPRNSGEVKLPYEEPQSDVIRVNTTPDMVKETSVGVLENNAMIGETRHTGDILEIKNEDPKPSIMCSLPSVMSSLSSSDSIVKLQAQRERFYNLPNAHIVAEDLDKPAEEEHSSDEASQEKDRKHLILHEDSMVEIDTDAFLSLTGAILESSVDLLLSSLRVAFFLPWCIAVGGALILSPEYLEPLAFGTGYIEPLSGIRRYSHWAIYGFQHIASFFTLIGAVVWLYPSLGYLSIGALLAQFCFTWHDFLIDSTIPLGEDDRQTVYLLATTTWLNHDNAVHIKEVGGSYYYSTRSLTTDSGLLDDSDEDVST